MSSSNTALIALVFVSVAAFAIGATPTEPVTFGGAPQYCLWSDNQSVLSVLPCSVSATHDDASPLPPNLLATAYYSVNMSTAGWDFLDIVPNLGVAGNATDLRRAYYNAGFIEGFLTSANFTQINLTTQTASLSPGALAWVTQHIEYMNATSRANAADRFWARVGMMLEQLRGQMDGVNLAASSAGPKCTFTDVFLVSFYFEAWDIKGKFPTTQQQQQQQAQPAAAHDDDTLGRRPTHCSAIVRATATDLYLAHTSWFRFEFMRRIMKTYHFDTVVVFSSYVGFIHSGDDWYMTSNQLAVTETSLSVTNATLWQLVVPQSVSEFIRVMTANYLAKSGSEWAELFTKANSGTYNNMFAVVDFKRFTPGRTIRDNTLWVSEQLPGVVRSFDRSAMLRADGFFGSYNVPLDATINVMSGNAANEAQYGSFFSYAGTSRGLIFRRNASRVNTLADVQRIIRFNHFQWDPLSAIPNCTGTVGGVCSPTNTPMLSIASRGDLAPRGTDATLGPLARFFRRGDIGAYDAKIASWKNRASLRALIISGPTTDDQVPFSFSANADLFGGRTAPPPGLPDTYDFPWVWKAPQAPVPGAAPAPDESIWENKQSVGAIIGGILGVLGVLLVVLYMRNSAASTAPPSSRGSARRNGGAAAATDEYRAVTDDVNGRAAQDE